MAKQKPALLWRDEAAECRDFEATNYRWTHRATKMGFSFDRKARGGTSTANSRENSSRPHTKDIEKSRVRGDSQASKRKSASTKKERVGLSGNFITRRQTGKTSTQVSQERENTSILGR